MIDQNLDWSDMTLQAKLYRLAIPLLPCPKIAAPENY